MLITSTHTITLSVTRHTRYQVDIGQGLVECSLSPSLAISDRLRALAIAAYIEAKESQEKQHYLTDIMYY